jgi:hypothetical protein
MARWSPWAWTPFIIIGLTAIPNAILIYGAKTVGISKVEPHPWVAAGRLDADKEQRAAFTAAGHRFTASVEGRSALCVHQGPAVLPAGSQVRAYRPSDAALDQVVPWTDSTAPLRIELPAPGSWILYLDLPGATAVAMHAVATSG